MVYNQPPLCKGRWQRRKALTEGLAGGNDKNAHFFVVTLFALLHPE